MEAEVDELVNNASCGTKGGGEILEVAEVDGEIPEVAKVDGEILDAPDVEGGISEISEVVGNTEDKQLAPN